MKTSRKIILAICCCLLIVSGVADIIDSVCNDPVTGSIEA